MKYWMRVPLFCEKYGISRTLVYVQKNKNLPACVFKKPSYSELYIDEKYFTRRLDFYNKVYESNQDIFFRLTEDCSVYALAKIYAPKMGVSVMSMNQWFSVGLFSMAEKSVLNVKLSKYHWKFYRLTRLL